MGCRLHAVAVGWYRSARDMRVAVFKVDYDFFGLTKVRAPFGGSAPLTSDGVHSQS
jgi:hypothetical protein